MLATALKAITLLALNTSGTQPKVIQDILKYVHAKGQGTGPKDEVGSVLYTRGVIIQVLSIEGCSTCTRAIW